MSIILWHQFCINFMVSRTLAIVFPFFEKTFKNEKKFPQFFFNHYIDIHIKLLVTL
jgi:hypothetical protein